MNKKSVFCCLLILGLVSGCDCLFSQTVPTPTITPAGSLLICQNAPVTLVSSATQGNVWSNGATTQTIQVASSGTFYVQQVVGNFTSAPSTPVTVTALPFTQATLTPVGPLCSNSPPVLLQGLQAGGVYSGNALVSTSLGIVFDPSLANPGNFNFIVYKVNAPGYPLFCVDTAEIRITVEICNGIDDKRLFEGDASVFPNPGSGHFTFISKNAAMVKRLRLIDLNGREVMAMDVMVDSVLRLDSGSLPSGVYFAELLFSDGTVAQRLRVFKSD